MRVRKARNEEESWCLGVIAGVGGGSAKAGDLLASQGLRREPHVTSFSEPLPHAKPNSRI